MTIVIQLSKTTKNYLIVQLKCVNFMIYKLYLNKVLKSRGREGYKGMEHVNNGMGLMCQRGVLHADCITNPKRKKTVHKRVKVEDENNEYGRRKEAHRCHTDRGSIVSNNCYKNRKCKLCARH